MNTFRNGMVRLGGAQNKQRLLQLKARLADMLKNIFSTCFELRFSGSPRNIICLYIDYN